MKNEALDTHLGELLEAAVTKDEFTNRLVRTYMANLVMYGVQPKQTHTPKVIPFQRPGQDD